MDTTVDHDQRDQRDQAAPAPLVSRSLSTLRAAILVADGVEEIEVTAPRDALRDAGASVRVWSSDGRDVRGYHYLEPRETVHVQGAVDDARAADVDLLVVPGGLGSPDKLRTDQPALSLLRRHAAAGKPIGVICHGPWVLVEAGVLAGRTLTCVPALRSDVTNAGATYVDAEVHVDRTRPPWIVSGRNFEAADTFARTLVEVLAA